MSRNFVKDMINQWDDGDHRFFYEHKFGDRLLADIPQIIYQRPLQTHDTTSASILPSVNTWVGNGKPFTGCNLETLHNLFSRGMPTLKLRRWQDYVPTINWDYFPLTRLPDLTGKRVLICNGPVLSGQATNFDFTGIIQCLALRFLEIEFIYTNPLSSPIHFPNVVPAETYVPYGTNLNEIANLSRSCDIIVGRGSGPYTFCIHSDNLVPGTKFISFCNADAHDLGMSGHCSAVFQNHQIYEPSAVLDILIREIEKL